MALATTKDDAYFMRLALRVARAALEEQGEVPVGCVLVHDGVVVSHGANQVNACRDATRHAEIVAFDRLLTGSVSTDQLRLPETYIKSKQDEREAGNDGSSSSANEGAPAPTWDDAWSNYEPDARSGWGVTSQPSEPLSKCTLYVTCEPCIMCAGAIRQLPHLVARTVYGCRNDKFGGCGSILPILTSDINHQVTEGVLEEECIDLLRAFYRGENQFAPENKRKKKEGGSPDDSNKKAKQDT